MNKKIMIFLLLCIITGCNKPSTTTTNQEETNIKQEQNNHEHTTIKQPDKKEEENKEEPVIKKEDIVVVPSKKEEQKPVIKEEIKEKEEEEIIIEENHIIEEYHQYIEECKQYSLYHYKQTSLIDHSYYQDYCEFSTTDGQYKLQSNLTGNLDLIWDESDIAMQLDYIDPVTDEHYQELLITPKTEKIINMIVKHRDLLDCFNEPMGLWKENELYHFTTSYNQEKLTTTFEHQPLLSRFRSTGEVNEYLLEVYNEGGYLISSSNIQKDHYEMVSEDDFINQLMIIEM